MIVLDTHALYWWINQTPKKLTDNQVEVIETADAVAVSAISCWEMGWLVAHGRIELDIPIDKWFDDIEQAGIGVLPITRRIALKASQLPEHHRDPADRIIIATAAEFHARLVSVDSRFPIYSELAGLLVGQ